MRHHVRLDAATMRASTPAITRPSTPAITRASTPAITRIGYEHPDSLITYPDAQFLSRWVVPIQMRPQGYPQGVYPLPVVSTGHHLALSSLLMMVRNFVYGTGFHHHHPSSRLTS